MQPILFNRLTKYVMRVHRVGYHTINGVRSELAWMQALRRDTQLETPIAIAGLDGEFVKLVDVDTHDEPRMVVLFEHIQGIQPEVEDLIDSFRQVIGFYDRKNASTCTTLDTT